MTYHERPRRLSLRSALKPHEVRHLSRLLTTQGGISELQVKAIARAKSCTTKAVVDVVKSRGFTIKSEAQIKQVGLGQLGPKLPASDQDPKSRAEALFEKTKPNTEKDLGDPERRIEDDNISILASEERRLLAEKEEADWRLTEREVALEDRVEKEAAKLAEEQERVREAFRRVAALREATKADRERIRDLQDELTMQRLRNAELEEELAKERRQRAESERDGRIWIRETVSTFERLKALMRLHGIFVDGSEEPEEATSE